MTRGSCSTYIQPRRRRASKCHTVVTMKLRTRAVFLEQKQWTWHRTPTCECELGRYRYAHQTTLKRVRQKIRLQEHRFDAGYEATSSLSDLEDQPALEQQKHGFVLLPLSSDLRYLHENKGARATSDRLLARMFGVLGLIFLVHLDSWIDAPRPKPRRLYPSIG